MTKFLRALVLPLLLAFAGQVLGAPPQFIDVRTFGAVPTDCSADVSANAQKGIDYVNSIGGGNLYFPYGCYKLNVTLKQGVCLVGQPGGYGDLASVAITRTRFTAAATGAVIDTPVGLTSNVCVVGIDIQGLGAGTAGKGIRFRNVSRGFIKSVNVNNVADEAILIEAPSIANIVEDALIINAVLNRTRAAVTGALDVAGTDHFISRVEATTSSSIEGVVSSVNLRVVAIAIRMTAGFVSNSVGEISDVGIYVSGNSNRFTGNRADLNYGHGWVITGSGNQSSSDLSLSNSQDTTNTYDNWNVSGVANIFNGPVSHFLTAKAPRYHFNDLAVLSDANKNYWNAPIVQGGIASSTAAFNNATSAWQFPSGNPRTLTANSATPRVDTFGGYGYFTTNNTVPTTWTSWPGGVDGQEIVILVADSNTTIQHNGAANGFVTANLGDVKLRNGVHYRLIKNGAWRFADDQATFADNVSADVGDAAKTLITRVNEPTQRWNTPLTANRAVTLSATGAYAGAKFRIVRQAGATGASTLDVGTGPLKSLAVGQWCDVEYNGAAWFLSAFGAL